MIIYYNPKCSKCREAKELLEGEQCSFEIRNYLEKPPTQKEIKSLLKKLNLKAIDIVRTKENLFKKNFKGKKLGNSKWIKILSLHPELMERPIVIDGEKAVIGRPPIKVLDLVK